MQSNRTQTRRVRRSLPGRLGVAVLAAALLLLVFRMYASGYAALASVCLAVSGVIVYLFASRRTYSYRYLVPGLLGLLVFAVLPIGYTVWMSSTNYSSRNLLTFERATQVLVGETYEREGGGLSFRLFRDAGA